MSAAAPQSPPFVITRPSFTQLLTLAGPVVISRSSQVVISLTDAAMVSDLGEQALAATTTGGMNTFNILILPMGIVTIVQTFAAQLMGRRQPMINALARLGGMQPGELPKSVEAMGITGGMGKLFATHPPIEERIAALQNAQG